MGAGGIIIGDSLCNFLVSIVSIFLGFALKEFIDWYKDKRQKFTREYLIKAELENIKHNLEVGDKRPDKIELDYGAADVRDRNLFGVYSTQVINWYKRFEDYNKKFEDIRMNHDHDGIQIMQHSMANLMVGILSNSFLKKIPSQPSDCSTIEFIRYLLGHDAKEPHS